MVSEDKRTPTAHFVQVQLAFSQLLDTNPNINFETALEITIAIFRLQQTNPCMTYEQATEMVLLQRRIFNMDIDDSKIATPVVQEPEKGERGVMELDPTPDHSEQLPQYSQFQQLGEPFESSQVHHPTITGPTSPFNQSQTVHQHGQVPSQYENDEPTTTAGTPRQPTYSRFTGHFNPDSRSAGTEQYGGMPSNPPAATLPSYPGLPIPPANPNIYHPNVMLSFVSALISNRPQKMLLKDYMVMRWLLQVPRTMVWSFPPQLMTLNQRSLIITLINLKSYIFKTSLDIHLLGSSTRATRLMPLRQLY